MPSPRDQVLKRLRDALPELERRFGVSSLRLFGSVAREEADAESDVDLLVAFSRPVGLFELADLRRRLAEILGRSVDVGTEGSLGPRMREAVCREAIDVA